MLLLKSLESDIFITQVDLLMLMVSTKLIVLLTQTVKVLLLVLTQFHKW